MTDKISDCLRDILAIADGPHPGGSTSHESELKVAYPVDSG